MKTLFCGKCKKQVENYRALKKHWYDEHPTEYKKVENWLDKDVDELRRLEQKAREGMQGTFAGVSKRG